MRITFFGVYIEVPIFGERPYLWILAASWVSVAAGKLAYGSTQNLGHSK